ncbi:hypothetical protein [Thiobacillus sp.]|nr:hypothetical protein [Thiobacillus sp.]
MHSWTFDAEGIVSAQAHVSKANVKALRAGRSPSDFICAAKVDALSDL